MGSIETNSNPSTAGKTKLGETAQLSHWISTLKYEDIPAEVQERVKYQLLDGIGCALVGARVPWSENYVQATSEYEPPGEYSVIGYNKKFGPLAAAMMNAAFVQATELDDYHAAAPVHNAAIMLPTVMAAAESYKHRFRPDGTLEKPETIDGKRFLLAVIAGIEATIRVGNGLYGNNMLARGWHCGAVYGAPGAAAAAAKLCNLDPEQTEDAIGVASTQACGLMAAQFGGMIKRVQHGFSARNGLIGAFLARGGYGGLKNVLEQPFGGFLAMFSSGNGKEPPYKPYEIVHKLGTHWETMHIRNKLYAAVGTAHGMIEILENMQASRPELFKKENLKNIKRIHAAQSHAGFHHDGWSPKSRPMEVTGSQMCAAYVMATQLVDGQVLLEQYASDKLDRDEVWDIVHKTTCSHDPYFDPAERLAGARVTVEFHDGTVLEQSLDAPRGYDPWVTNEELVEKFRKLAATVVDAERAKQIEETVLRLDSMEDVTELIELLAKPVAQSLA
jgi:aconitate decarboxylase